MIPPEGTGQVPGLQQLLGDRYRLVELIAVGGMGEVWRAVDRVLNREVAVKVLRTDLADGDAFQRRFRAEARTAAMLSHEGIAATYDYGEAGSGAYLVMELIRGEPLSAMIARQGVLPSDLTLDLVAQAARALHAAHTSGVIHRDVKPANILVTEAGRVKITDFGIARPQDHEPLTGTGQVMGTAHYLAPEVARGRTASPLSDIYALGVVMYECLAGWRPFDGTNQVEVASAHLEREPPPLADTIPAAVRTAVAWAMAKDANRRPQSAAEFADYLDQLREDRDTPPPAGFGAPGAAGPAAALGPHPANAAAPGGPGPGTSDPEGPASPVPPTSAIQQDQLRRPRDRGSWWQRVPRLPLIALGCLIALVVAGALIATLGDDPDADASASPSVSPQPSEASTPAGTWESVPTTSLAEPSTSSTSTSSASPTSTSERRTTTGTSSSTRTTASSTSVSDQTNPTTGSGERIEVRAQDYYGQQSGDAVRFLSDLGFAVTVREEASAQPQNTVIGVEPSGSLVRGSAVVVVVSGGPGG